MQEDIYGEALSDDRMSMIIMNPGKQEAYKGIVKGHSLFEIVDMKEGFL